MKAIIPARLMNEGVRLGGKLGGSVILELYEKAAGIRINGSIRMWTSLIEGQYPACEGIIPSEYVGTVAVPKGALCSAVSRAGALSKGRRLAGLALVVEGSQLVLRLDEDAGDGITAVERVAPGEDHGNGAGLRVEDQLPCPMRLRVCLTFRGWRSSSRTKWAKAWWRFRVWNPVEPDCWR